jgi:hypothetical protein
MAYGTRHDKGLETFREVEYKALRDHERTRAIAKETKDVKVTGQTRLFSVAEFSAAIVVIVASGSNGAFSCCVGVLTPDLAVQLTASSLRTEATPLFEKEGHVLFAALLTNFALPRRPSRGWDLAL